MSKPVILTGLRANNDLHIGNYFGALLPIVDMARARSDGYQINLFVPDLHSFTTPIDHSELQAQTMHNVKIYAAAGLDLQNDNIFLYRQSYISAHSELTWILDCFTGFGEMGRMTQFKDKSSDLSVARMSELTGFEDPMSHPEIDLEEVGRKLERRTTVGLFNYPVLMAADILLYHAKYVPVGDDQTQHLEFTRDIAARMNNRFGELFTVPEPVKRQHEFFGKDQGLRIRDLVDPTKKMSKSDELGKGVIFLGDNPEAAAKKIMSATTDSFGEIHFDVKERPGISNLLQILALLEKKTLDEVIKSWEGKTSYGELKNAVAENVKKFLIEFQARLSEVNDHELLQKLEESEYLMREVADQTLLKVQRAVGLRPENV